MENNYEKRNNREDSSIEIVTNLLTTKLNCNVESTTQRYDSFDIAVTGHTGNEYSFEIKERLLTCQQFIGYLQKGMILEKMKYDKLIKSNGVYGNIVRFDDYDVFISWNMKDVDLKVQDIECPWTTEREEYRNNTKQIKPCYLCSLDKANSVYIRVNNEWSKATNQQLIDKLQNKTTNTTTSLESLEAVIDCFQTLNYQVEQISNHSIQITGKTITKIIIEDGNMSTVEFIDYYTNFKPFKLNKDAMTIKVFNYHNLKLLLVDDYSLAFIQYMQFRWKSINPSKVIQQVKNAEDRKLFYNN